jgi:hypothetical protein
MDDVDVIPRLISQLLGVEAGTARLSSSKVFQWLALHNTAYAKQPTTLSIMIPSF